MQGAAENCNEEIGMLIESFRRAEWELTGPLASHKINLQYSGTTVNMIMIRDKYLYCGNVGDSRAVIASLRPLDHQVNARETVVQLP